MSITISDLNLIGIEKENANINVVQKGNFFSSFCFRITTVLRDFLSLQKHNK